MSQEGLADPARLLPQLVEECCRGSAGEIRPDAALTQLLDRGALRDPVSLVPARGVVLAASRYRDAYVRSTGRWVLSRQAVRFRYAVPAPEYSRTLPEPDPCGSPARLPGRPQCAPSRRSTASGPAR